MKLKGFDTIHAALERNQKRIDAFSIVTENLKLRPASENRRCAELMSTRSAFYKTIESDTYMCVKGMRTMFMESTESSF